MPPTPIYSRKAQTDSNRSDHALAIGRQADPLGSGEVQTRMDAARARRTRLMRPTAPASAPDKPLLSKIRSWLTVKEIKPAA